MSFLSDIDAVLKKIEGVAAHILPFLVVAKAAAPGSDLPTVAALSAAQTLITVADATVQAEALPLTADQQMNVALNVAQQAHEAVADAGGTTEQFDNVVAKLKPAITAVQLVNAANAAANAAAGTPAAKSVTVANLVAPVSGIRG